MADYADTLAYLGRPFGCTATPSAAWGSSVAKARRGAGGQDCDGQPTGKTGEQSKVCGC